MLSVVALIALIAAVPLAYANRNILDSARFAERTTVVLSDPAVEDRVVDELTDAVIEAQRELLTYRPLVASIVRGIITSSAGESLIERSVAELHRSLLDPDDGLVVTVNDLLLLVRTQIAALAPELLDETGLRDGVEFSIDSDLVERVGSTTDRVQNARLVLLVVAALALLGTVLLADERRRGAVRAGRAMIASGLAVLAVTVLARVYALRGLDGTEAELIGNAIWTGYIGGLATWAMVLAALGVVVVGIAGSDVRNAGATLRAAFIDGDDRSVTAQAIPPALLGVVCAWALVQPMTAVRLVVILAAGGGLVVAAQQLIVVGSAYLASRRSTTRERREDDGDDRPIVDRRWFVVAATLLIVIAVVVAAWGTDGDETATVDDERCNGSTELCDRPLNEVTIAATHNSMSAARDGYIRANHDSGIIEQLDAGFRGLLIDTWYGIESTRGVVITDRINVSPAEQAALEAELGAEAVAAAEAAQEREVTRGAERGMYLCHGFCELGATPLVEELTTIRRWMEENPREVVVMIIQDEVSPADTADAFEQAGLDELVATLDIDEPVPTLAEMLDDGTPLLVMMENEVGDVPWLHDAFTFTQDTPYDNASPDDFRCDENRGTADSPFFLINHFVGSPDPVAADTSNTFDNVSAALRECRVARDAWPSMIAVDFWSRGGVLDAVDAQNLLGATPDDG